jgi:hypothetical protein
VRLYINCKEVASYFYWTDIGGDLTQGISSAKQR